jgi:hypothetical protein
MPVHSFFASIQGAAMEIQGSLFPVKTSGVFDCFEV